MDRFIIELKERLKLNNYTLFIAYANYHPYFWAI